MASPFPKRSSFEQIYIYPSWGSFHTFTILSQIVSKTRIFKDISFYFPIKNPPYPHSQIWPTLPQGIWFDLWINTTSECFHTSNSFLDKRILRRKKLILLVYFSEQMVFEIKIFFNFLYFLYILLCIYLTPSLWSHPTHGNRDLKNKSQIYTTWGCFYTSYSFSGQYRIKWTCIIFFFHRAMNLTTASQTFLREPKTYCQGLKFNFQCKSCIFKLNLS